MAARLHQAAALARDHHGQVVVIVRVAVADAAAVNNAAILQQTLFAFLDRFEPLDEIGELSLELQAKLLRAIQEKEIERVGGKSTLKVNVRIIAATNRDLSVEVEEKRFRADLFYRLNVFPITLPPLRDRTNDIAPLAAHFAAKFARKSGRKVLGIADHVLRELTQYEWPGNVRELEHLIERGILLASGPTITEIHIPDVSRGDFPVGVEDSSIKTIDENEREHILRVLKKCSGKISGYDGAAEVLGVPASTLNSKMKKLGIRKEHVFSADQNSYKRAPRLNRAVELKKTRFDLTLADQ